MDINKLCHSIRTKKLHAQIVSHHNSENITKIGIQLAYRSHCEKNKVSP